MSGKITLITPTGDRPVAFDLCRRWMRNQTIQADQWIIIDDGKVPMDAGSFGPEITYIRREPKPTDYKHTLTINIREAIPLISGDKILIIEDDEYYAPAYVEEMARRLDDYEVVGIGCSKYYHIQTGGYDIHKNMFHASLAQTGFRKSFLSIFTECVLAGMETAWLDDRLWTRVQKSKGTKNEIRSLIFVDDDESLYAGIKGIPGRHGIGIGHKTESYRLHPEDPGREQLKKWVPNDYVVYLDLLGEMAA
jgi:hypothetical protein